MQPITFGMSATAGEYIFDQISTTNITSGTAGFTLHDNIITNISSGTGNQYIYRVIVNGKTNFTVDANGKITGNGAGLTNLSGMIQTFATNITIVSATNTTISFAPGFADTNYVVNIPPVFVGGYINFKSTNSFTLSFPSLSLSGIPAEGTVVHR